MNVGCVEVAAGIPEHGPVPEFPGPQALAAEAINFPITGAIVWILTNQPFPGQDVTSVVQRTPKVREQVIETRVPGHTSVPLILFEVCVATRLT